jgi:hypothetical protein
MVAEGLSRRWIAVEEVAEYLEASTFRFEEVDMPSIPSPQT